MKTKITILAAGLGIAALAGVAYAATDAQPDTTQPAVSAAPHGPLQERLAEKLGLNADQQKALSDLRTQMRSEMGDLKADTNLTRDERRDQVRAIAKKYRDQMRAVLTPEQQKTADELRAHARKRFESFAEARGPRDGDRRGPGMGPGRERGGRDPMSVIAMADRIKDRVADELNLSDEQRDKLEHLSRAYREEMRTEAQKHRDEMRAVLTPEQQKQFDQMRERFGRGDRGGPPPFAGMERRPHHLTGDADMPPPPETE